MTTDVFFSSMPRVFIYDQVSSSQDVAFELIANGKMGLWDSVLARSQTRGRGQMRRHWVSQAGNIYASLRLPLVAPFDSTAAPMATSLLCASALRKLGHNIMLKWPNDLILPCKGDYKKIGGILLEERGQALVAGIGIDVTSAPEVLREGGALPAGFLAEAGDFKECPSMEEMWRIIVKSMVSDYKISPSFSGQWKSGAESILLWRGDNVEILDNQELCRGRLAGLEDSGGALLEDRGRLVEIRSGSMRQCPGGQAQ